MSGFVPDSSSMEINYRQVGRRKTGRVVAGKKGDTFTYKEPTQEHTLLRARVKRVQNSIPTKYETTVFVGQRARNAFGCRSGRFSYADNELPGPGNYHRPTTLLRDPATSGSISHKGYGALVSKTSRFSDRTEHDLKHLPAPGSYNMPEFAPKRGYSVASSSACMAKPSVTIVGRKRSGSVPGPGHYIGVSPMTASAGARIVSRKGTSSFAGPHRKPPATAAAAVPGAGAYNLPSSIVAPKLPVGSAAFKSGAPRLGRSGTGGIPVPGPGSYNPAPIGKLDVVKTTSLFGNTGNDRWGKPKTRKAGVLVPGPGAYNAKVPSRRSPKAAAAAFKSTSKRGDYGGGVKPPGPAFYKTDGADRRSFLLNPTGKWV